LEVCGVDEFKLVGASYAIIYIEMKHSSNDNLTYDIIIIGAGIIGLATTRTLLIQHPNLKLLILEKESDIALHQTGRNSGVIHSGIYYKPKSLKALTCLEGYQLLLDYVKEKNIPYELCGKLIVATEAKELDPLKTLYQKGLEHGLTEIKLISGEEAKQMEPNLTCLQAIWVPYTGIVNYKEVCKRFLLDIVSMGGQIKYHAEVTSIHQSLDEIKVQLKTKQELKTRFLMGCGGLQSDRIAKMADFDLDFKIVPFKGNYFKLNDEKKDIVKHLIYPVPDARFPFLGIHYTKMINGDQTLGPNALLALDREGYSNGDFKWRDAWDSLSFIGLWKLLWKYWRTGLSEMYKNNNMHYFARKASMMTPNIKIQDLKPYPSGIRAQVLDKKGTQIDDFLILQKENMIHVCNAPSPAATASMAIAKHIVGIYNQL